MPKKQTQKVASKAPKRSNAKPQYSPPEYEEEEEYEEELDEEEEEDEEANNSFIDNDIEEEDVFVIGQAHPFRDQPFEGSDLGKGQAHGRENGIGKEHADPDQPRDQEYVGFQRPLPVDPHALFPCGQRGIFRSHRQRLLPLS